MTALATLASAQQIDYQRQLKNYPAVNTSSPLGGGGTLSSSLTVTLNVCAALQVYQTNPAGNGWQCVTLNFAGAGSCGSSTWAQVLNAGAPPTCTNPNPGFQVFTSSGTYTIPSGVTCAKITVVAGGGGGGGTSNAGTDHASGGGSGSASIKWQCGLTPGNTLTVTVGVGGTGGTGAANGGTGTASSVSSGTQSITTITTNPGIGGFNSTVTIPFQGGNGGAVGSGGDMNLAGQVGYSPNANGPGGAGAPSFLGGEPFTFSVNASNSTTPGTGGAGAGTSGANNTGGNGGNGIVIFEWVK